MKKKISNQKKTMQKNFKLDNLMHTETWLKMRLQKKVKILSIVTLRKSKKI